MFEHGGVGQVSIRLVTPCADGIVAGDYHCPDGDVHYGRGLARTKMVLCSSELLLRYEYLKVSSRGHASVSRQES